MCLTVRIVLSAVLLALVAPSAQGQILAHDSGQMEELADVDTAGISVRFHSPSEADLTAFQFYGCRGGEGGSPADSFFVRLKDGEGNLLRELEKPLWNIGAGRALWQTVSISPPVRVNGDFEIHVAADPRAAASLRVGRDGPTDSGRWMVRAHLLDPSRAPERSAARGRTRPTSEGSTAAPREITKAAAENQPRRLMAAPSPTSQGVLAYRDQHRRLSFPRKPPPIPPGCGRVDIHWDAAPATVELSYVGKPPRILEGLDVRRLVVDFPVPEPGLFEVTVRKEGYRPESRRFLVSAGSRHEWHIRLRSASETDGRGENPGPEVPPVVIEELVQP
ncbi:MAG: hypothetical protein KatS3mg024_0726 [Armatimonadota bacterium]|nr:MAG: hypothetical protein KatS3mg024_0726 [Armatimonadota bacterium]